MKKIITLFLILFSIIYIYILTYDQKIYYLSISNNYNSNDFSNIIAKKLQKNDLLDKYVNEFSNNNNRIIDYLDMIEDNKYIIKDNKKIYLKNALIKADIISISLGSKDYINDYSEHKNKVISIRNNVDRLISKIREYSKEDIYFISIYSDEIDKRYLNKLNEEIKEICTAKKVKFINIDNNYNYITKKNSINISKYIINNK